MSSAARPIGTLACLALASCSAVSSNVPIMDLLPAPTAPTLMIDSTPPGAEARASYGGVCRTPCELPIPVTDTFTVTYTLEGYLPQTIPVRAILAVKSALIDTTPPRFEPNPLLADLKPAPPPEPPPVKKRQRP
ncbi:MAG TPA: hypothetical protein VIY51_08470 [Xanthobacteraceae bacterium]